MNPNQRIKKDQTLSIAAGGSATVALPTTIGDTLVAISGTGTAKVEAVIGGVAVDVTAAPYSRVPEAATAVIVTETGGTAGVTAGVAYVECPY